MAISQYPLAAWVPNGKARVVVFCVAAAWKRGRGHDVGSCRRLVVVACGLQQGACQLCHLAVGQFVDFVQGQAGAAYGCEKPKHQ